MKSEKDTNVVSPLPISTTFKIGDVIEAFIQEEVAPEL